MWGGNCSPITGPESTALLASRVPVQYKADAYKLLGCLCSLLKCAYPKLELGLVKDNIFASLDQELLSIIAPIAHAIARGVLDNEG